MHMRRFWEEGSRLLSFSVFFRVTFKSSFGLRQYGFLFFVVVLDFISNFLFFPLTAAVELINVLSVRGPVFSPCCAFQRPRIFSLLFFLPAR